MKTYRAKKETVERKWYLVDATDYPLGRLATRIADILRGKTKPTYTPGVDTGDFVVVINAEKVALSGNKELGKLYTSYSGYPGGLKVATAAQIRDKKPEYLVERAVTKMLPKNKLSSAIVKKLKIVVGSEHKYEAQKPEKISL